MTKQILDDQTHQKARDYYKQYMSRPGNREKTRTAQRHRYNPEKAKQYREKWLAKNPGAMTRSYAKRPKTAIKPSHCISCANHDCSLYPHPCKVRKKFQAEGTCREYTPKKGAA